MFSGVISVLPVRNIFGRMAIMVLSLWIGLIPMDISGQSDADIDPGESVSTPGLAPVIVDGYELFKIRGVSSFPAEARARTIEHRIRKMAANTRFSIDSLQKVEIDEHIQIRAGFQPIMNIYEEDAEVEQVSKEVLAELFFNEVRKSIIRYRTERTRAYIQSATIKALIASGVLLVSMLLFIFLFKKINVWFKGRIRTKIENLENVSFKLIQSNQLFGVLEIIYRLLRFVILAVVLVFFVDYILGLFPGTRKLANSIFNIIVAPLESIAFGFIKALPNLIFLLFIFLLTQYVLKLVRLFFHGIDLEEIRIQNFDPEWAMPTFRIIKLLVIIFALVIAYPYIPGSSSSAFQGISVFLGVLFSLGSSSFIANIIAGYSMTYRRAFKKGDRIQVDSYMGFVEEQSLMVTRLRSIKNEEIIIPNSTLLNSSIKNYTQAAKERGVILHTSVGIGYETSWRLVESMLLEAARRTPGLLQDPPPYILQKSLGDFAVTYELNAYCNDPVKMYFIHTEMHRHILDVFNENNVQIMTPAYEGDPAVPKVVPKEQWNTPLASDVNQKSNS